MVKKQLVSYIFILLFVCTTVFLVFRSRYKAFNSNFKGIVKNIYVCSRLDLCVELSGYNNEFYLGLYGCQKGEKPEIKIGDSLSKNIRSYNLHLYKKTEGKFQKTYTFYRWKD